MVEGRKRRLGLGVGMRGWRGVTKGKQIRFRGHREEGLGCGKVRE